MSPALIYLHACTRAYTHFTDGGIIPGACMIPVSDPPMSSAGSRIRSDVRSIHWSCLEFQPRKCTRTWYVCMCMYVIMKAILSSQESARAPGMCVCMYMHTYITMKAILSSQESVLAPVIITCTSMHCFFKEKNEKQVNTYIKVVEIHALWRAPCCFLRLSMKCERDSSGPRLRIRSADSPAYHTKASSRQCTRSSVSMHSQHIHDTMSRHSTGNLRPRAMNINDKWSLDYLLCC